VRETALEKRLPSALRPTYLCSPCRPSPSRPSSDTAGLRPAPSFRPRGQLARVGEEEEAAELGTDTETCKGGRHTWSRGPSLQNTPRRKWSGRRGPPGQRLARGSEWGSGLGMQWPGEYVLVGSGQEADGAPGTEGVLRNEPHSGTWPGYFTSKPRAPLGCLKGTIF